jgi:hypothetical protein
MSTLRWRFTARAVWAELPCDPARSRKEKKAQKIKNRCNCPEEGIVIIPIARSEQPGVLLGFYQYCIEGVTPGCCLKS